VKALTLIQPWAYAIEALGKRIENRTWRPPDTILGFRIAIHSGKKVDRDSCEDLEADGHRIDRKALVRGAITSSAIVRGWVMDDGAFCNRKATRWVGVTPEEAAAVVADRYWVGPVGWVLDEVHVLEHPVPCSGALGLWTVPGDVAARVRAERRAVAPVPP
jgi:hypothetical protein